jgi:hypothetical protein
MRTIIIANEDAGIKERKPKGFIGRVRFVLSSNDRKKEPLEQQLIRAFLLYKP